VVEKVIHSATDLLYHIRRAIEVLDATNEPLVNSKRIKAKSALRQLDKYFKDKDVKFESNAIVFWDSMV